MEVKESERKEDVILIPYLVDMRMDKNEMNNKRMWMDSLDLLVDRMGVGPERHHWVDDDEVGHSLEVKWELKEEEEGERVPSYDGFLFVLFVAFVSDLVLFGVPLYDIQTSLPTALNFSLVIF